MDNVLTVIKFTGATLTALFTYIFGGVDAVLVILLAFITLDYITGVMAGIVTKQLSSEIGFKGLFKKICILILVAVAHLIGSYLGFDVRTWVIGYYIANEGISIMENIGRIGVPYPPKLLEILKQLQNKDSDSRNGE